MGFLGRLFGIEAPQPARAPRPAPASRGAGPAAPLSDAQALERYRYMLQTAPPETIEEAHREAFAKLTPDQRRQVLAELSKASPPAERAALASTPVDDTQALARAATRAEIRQPGVMERTLGGGMGIGASLLSSFAMGFVGSMVASSFLSAMNFGGESGAPEAEADAGAEDANAGDTELAGYDDGYDDGGGFDGGGDFEV